jgi:hypothetical protein
MNASQKRSSSVRGTALLGHRQLSLTAFATAVLLLKLSPISDLAEAAGQATFSSTSQTDLKLSLLVHALGGLVVLLVISVLAIYKPAGLTPLALRAGATAEGVVAEASPIPAWVRVSLILAMSLALVVALLVMHGGHGPAMHSSQGL